MLRFVVVLFVAIQINLGYSQDDFYGAHQLNVQVPEVALLSVHTNQGQNLNGNSLEVSRENKDQVWVNYSSVHNHQKKRAVMVFLEENNLPKGVLLTVKASNARSGHGALGITAGEVLVTNQPQPIIDQIGTAYTESGPKKGHLLEFSVNYQPEHDPIAMAEATADLSVNVNYIIVDY